jgi:hypothetical protein
VLGDPDRRGSGRRSNERNQTMEKFTLVADGIALAAVVVAVMYVKPAL